MMQHDVITPNPGYKIAANRWDLNIAQCVHAPSPLGTFIRHCNTMESPYFPTYSQKGTSAPADSMSDLNHSTSFRMKRSQHAQPHWAQQMLNPLQPVPPAPPSVPSQQASSSSASMVPVKPAPMTRNPSMASAPVNAPLPQSMGADPWAEARIASMVQSEQTIAVHLQKGSNGIR